MTANNSSKPPSLLYIGIKTGLDIISVFAKTGIVLLAIWHYFYYFNVLQTLVTLGYGVQGTWCSVVLSIFIIAWASLMRFQNEDRFSFALMAGIISVPVFLILLPAMQTLKGM